MLVECIACHKFYNVSKYEAGQKLRCECGQIIVVPDNSWKPRAVLTLHCTNCGGNLEKGQPTCLYCGALVDLSSSRLTAYCTHCLSMSKENARFCSGCGKPLVAQLKCPEQAEELCPRCTIPMRVRDLESHQVEECPVCLGLFVSVNAFESLVKKQEIRASEQVGSDGASRASLNIEAVTYIKCPKCQGVMNRMNYARFSGVIVDYCRKHGYWLDNGELEKIADFVASGGLVKKYQVEMEEAKSDIARSKFEKTVIRLEEMQDPYLNENNQSIMSNGFFKFIVKILLG